MFLRNWFGLGVRVSAELQDQIDTWKAIAAAPPETPIQNMRFVVLDTETSGLDTRQDALLSIGAVGLSGLTIRLNDSFDAVLRQATASQRTNIVVHGIGQTEQLDGEDPATALARFLQFAGKAPLIAYHAPFDEAFVNRTIAGELGLKLGLPWLDLAAVLPALFDEKQTHAPLDYWLERFSVEVAIRHAALGDALATAQLAQIAFRKGLSRGLLNFPAVARLARDARWLPR